MPGVSSDVRVGVTCRHAGALQARTLVAAPDDGAGPVVGGDADTGRLPRPVVARHEREPPGPGVEPVAAEHLPDAVRRDPQPAPLGTSELGGDAARAEPRPTEPATTEPPTTTPKVATGKIIGDNKLTVYDQSGKAQLELTITRVKFTRGDEFDRPQHGLWMGALVKVHALAENQYLLDPNIYARVGGRLYRQAIPLSEAFDPWLAGTYLFRGQRDSGWLVFDVPARHGQLVLRDTTDKHQLAVWKY